MDYILLSAVEYIGDSNARLWVLTNEPKFWYIAATAYVGVFQVLIMVLRRHNVLRANVMWDGVSAVVESVLAYLLLGDRLDSPIQYAGLGFIIVGLFMLGPG